MSNSDKIIELSKYESFMEEPKKFEESIYSSTYKKTKSLVKKLLDESEYIEEEKLRRKIGALDKKEINNMIAFVGKRGTGKTTAMFSFLNYFWVIAVFLLLFGVVSCFFIYTPSTLSPAPS